MGGMGNIMNMVQQMQNEGGMDGMMEQMQKMMPGGAHGANMMEQM